MKKLRLGNKKKLQTLERNESAFATHAVVHFAKSTSVTHSLYGFGQNTIIWDVASFSLHGANTLVVK